MHSIDALKAWFEKWGNDLPCWDDINQREVLELLDGLHELVKLDLVISRNLLTPVQVGRIMELVEFGGYVPQGRREGFRSDLYALLKNKDEKELTEPIDKARKAYVEFIDRQIELLRLGGESLFPPMWFTFEEWCQVGGPGPVMREGDAGNPEIPLSAAQAYYSQYIDEWEENFPVHSIPLKRPLTFVAWLEEHKLMPVEWEELRGFWWSQ